MPQRKRTPAKTHAPTARNDAPKPLAGKTALVTGAARGVGKGIALTLARAGCAVAINHLSDTDLAAKTVREIEALGVDSFAIQADVRSSAQINRMFATLRKKFTKLDLLVNNAGTQTWAPLLDLKEADWDRDIATNVKGTFLCLQAAARWMKETGGGSIINIGSGSNKVPFPRLVSYTASKGAVEMLTRVAATELGRFRIRVNCVAPGAVLIDRTAKEDPHYARIWGRQAPMGRVGFPEDVGNAVVFLASDQATFISAQTLWVDGAAFTQASWPYKLTND